MTDVATTQIAAHGVRFPSLRAPVLDIGRGIGRFLKACGRGFGDLSRAYVHALEVAYVRPVGISAREQQLTPDGRDPNW